MIFTSLTYRMPRNIDDIIPPSRRPQPPQRERVSEDPVPVYTPKRPRNRSSWGIALVVIILLVGTVVGGSYLFSGVEITVTPRLEQVTITADGTAFSVAGSGALAFKTVSFDIAESSKIPATGEETVAERAMGKITIFNDYSTTPQRLIRNTRFESPGGLIYRIQDPVVVPGKTTSAPGKIEVTVYADEPGERFNIGSGKFTIPGLAGSPQFASMYAESNAPMLGGYEGRRPTVDAATEASARAALQDTLRTKLEAGILSAVPEGYTLLPGSVRLSYERLAPADAALTGTVEIREGGKAVAPVFETRQVASFVAERTLGAAYNGEPLTFTDVQQLNLSIHGSDFTESAEMINFTISGQTTLVWEVDENGIKGAIAGKNREEVESIVTSFPAIQKAHVVIRPFWEKFLPENPSDIPVIVEEVR